jgi:pilus assembly protein CpaC
MLISKILRTTFCSIIFALIFNSITLSQTEMSRTRIVRLSIGHYSILDFDNPAKRVSISNPEIADVTVTSPHQLLINGKAFGTTTMIVWDEFEEYTLFELAVNNQAAEHQIMLQVHFVEITKSAFKQIGSDILVSGINWDSQEVTMGSFAGKVSTPNEPLLLSDNVDFFLSIPTKDFSAIFKAMEQNNCLTTLAKPNLSAVNGAEASFLAGGEFPIPVVSGTAGMQTVTIVFKEYGIKLKFVPTVLNSDQVNIKVAAEVSKLDFENGITLSGFRIPSLITRKTETIVELRKGQYLILGGLFSEEVTETISKIPGLGHIPILGKLFSSKRFLNQETELLILVSPAVIQSFSGDRLPISGN